MPHAVKLQWVPGTSCLGNPLNLPDDTAGEASARTTKVPLCQNHKKKGEGNDTHELVIDGFCGGGKASASPPARCPTVMPTGMHRL
jgi:hypothetical protein